MFREGDFVEFHGLLAQQELNGSRGYCIAWDANSLRWDVRLDDDDFKHVNVQPKNLVKLRDAAPALQSNNGWTGKSVHSWMFGDAQEDVSFPSGGIRVVITVRACDTNGGKLTFSNMAGEEVAVIDSPLHAVTFQQAKCVVAEAIDCDAGHIEFIFSDGRVMLGLEHWALAEAQSS